MSDWSSVAVRFGRAVREMRGESGRSEAVCEFLAAREALRAALDPNVGRGARRPEVPRDGVRRDGGRR